MVSSMSFPRRKMREIVFRMIFSENVTRGCSARELASVCRDESGVTRKVLRQAYERMRNVYDHMATIDGHIQNASTAYAFERISNVEKNVLRLAVYELLFDTSVPPQVVMAEAIRLSRKFGTPEGGEFVNAVIDTIYKSMDSP